MLKEFNGTLLFYVLESKGERLYLYTDRRSCEEYGKILEAEGQKPSIKICEVMYPYFDTTLDSWDFEEQKTKFEEVMTLSWHTR